MAGAAECGSQNGNSAGHQIDPAPGAYSDPSAWFWASTVVHCGWPAGSKSQLTVVMDKAVNAAPKRAATSADTISPFCFFRFFMVLSVHCRIGPGVAVKREAHLYIPNISRKSFKWLILKGRKKTRFLGGKVRFLWIFTL